MGELIGKFPNSNTDDTTDTLLEDSSSLLYKQMASVTKNAFHQLQLISQLWPFQDRKDPATMMHTLVISRLDYCKVLHVRLPLKSTQKLQWE